MSENKIKKSTLRILNNFNPALVSSLTSLGLLAPEFLPFVALGQSILSYYGEYANRKTIDLLQEFKKNKDKINQEIVQSDKFKASFIKIVSDNITESNEEKRQLLKNYILNFACGVEPDFNEHSRIINVLNTISLYEIEMLKLWDDGEIIEDWYKNNSPSSRVALDIAHIEGIVINSPYKYRLEWGRQNQERNNQTLLSLGYTGLLWVLGETNFGGGQEATVKDLTEFGKIFLKFIKK